MKKASATTRIRMSQSAKKRYNKMKKIQITCTVNEDQVNDFIDHISEFGAEDIEEEDLPEEC